MLIGLAGKKQTGKNLVGKMLLCLDDYQRIHSGSGMDRKLWVTSCSQSNLTESLTGMKTVSFAAKLKQIVATIFNVDPSWFENEEFKNSPIPEAFINCRVKTYREALQYIGTDLFRNQFCKNVWITSTLSNYNPESDKWIITDVRFPDEVDAIKRLGGIVVYINRPIKVGNKMVDSTTQHASETALDLYRGYDFCICNDGSIEDLYDQVEKFYDNFILSKK